LKNDKETAAVARTESSGPTKHNHDRIYQRRSSIIVHHRRYHYYCWGGYRLCSWKHQQQQQQQPIDELYEEGEDGIVVIFFCFLDGQQLDEPIDDLSSS